MADPQRFHWKLGIPPQQKEEYYKKYSRGKEVAFYPFPYEIAKYRFTNSTPKLTFFGKELHNKEAFIKI